ncbi:hypothetical protein GGF46_000054 [Coemansia sp. RSA 552]|nr:hypothetical protein GGF46_000054 [Coemansia sp. RSA 552]
MQTVFLASVAIAAAAAAAAANAEPANPVDNSAFETDVSHYQFDDSEYNYCDPGYPSASSYTAVPDATLELVQAVVRHGDRTPIRLIADDSDTSWACSDVEENIYLHARDEPARNTTGTVRQVIEIPKWNQEYGFSNQAWQGTCEAGQLTDHGKRQHNMLGTQLRSIYVDKLGYLPAKLNGTDEVYVRTTFVWRTKNSAESLLGGLWPGRGVGPEDSIPLHSYPQRIETMSANTIACPRLLSLEDEISKTEGFQKFLREQGPLMSKLMEAFGVDGPEWTTGWDRYFDVLNARTCHKQNLPCRRAQDTGKATAECATPEDTRQVTRNSNYEWAYKYRDSPQSQNLTRLTIGSFAGTLREQIEGRIAGKTGNLKFALYSGHDTTVWPLLTVLGASNRENLWPPYASNLIIELWRKHDNSRVVRVLFNGHVLQVKKGAEWCDLNACPLDTFLSRISRFIPTNIAAECTAP